MYSYLRNDALGGEHLYCYVRNSTPSTYDYLGLAQHVSTMTDAELAALWSRLEHHALTRMMLEHPQAAKALLHWLRGGGADYHLNPQLVMDLRAAQRGIDENNERIRGWIKKVARQIESGSPKKRYVQYWDAQVKVKKTEINEREFLGTLNWFVITTYVYVDAERSKKMCDILGFIEHLAWDKYDFDPEKLIPIPGLGIVPGKDMVALVDHGLAHDFYITSWMHQTIAAQHAFRWFTDHYSIHFTELSPEKGGRGVYEEVLRAKPEAKRP